MAVLEEAESLPSYEQAMADSKKRSRSDSIDAIQEGNSAGKDIAPPPHKRKKITRDGEDGGKEKRSRRPGARYDSVKVRQLKGQDPTKQTIAGEAAPPYAEFGQPGLSNLDAQDLPSEDLSDFKIKKPLLCTQTTPGPTASPPSSFDSLKLLKIDHNKIKSSQAAAAAESSPRTPTPSACDKTYQVGSNSGREAYRIQAEAHEFIANKFKETANKLSREAALVLAKATDEMKKAEDHRAQALL